MHGSNHLLIKFLDYCTGQPKQPKVALSDSKSNQYPTIFDVAHI